MTARPLLGAATPEQAATRCARQGSSTPRARSARATPASVSTPLPCISPDRGKGRGVRLRGIGRPGGPRLRYGFGCDRAAELPASRFGSLQGRLRALADRRASSSATAARMWSVSRDAKGWSQPRNSTPASMWFAVKGRCGPATLLGSRHQEVWSDAHGRRWPTEHQLMCMFGWDDPKQAATYTRKARQQKLARASMHLLSSKQNKKVS